MAAMVISAILGYMAGSIPFSYLAGKLTKGIDLREHGSGNLGASNTFRILGPKIAALVLAGDAAKGFVPVHYAFVGNVFSRELGMGGGAVHWLMLSAALAAVLGHMFSIFLRFTGGKGIATSAGAFLALDPWAFAGAFTVWLVLFLATRIVSIASLAAAVSLPFCVYLAGRIGLSDRHWSLLVLAIFITMVVVAKHKSNIQRLMAGTEPMLARKKSK
jgi:glycerol-3-phosphate acyltransferase PlsY